MCWQNELNALARKVGFEQRTTCPTLKESTPPNELLNLWQSNYASILTWQPSNLTDGENRWRRVQDYFDNLLMDKEKDGIGTSDGFLIVVLSESPATETDALISRIQTDTAVCRKHVLWPGKNGHADISKQLLELTPLGLPDAERAVETAQLPGLSAEQRIFVERIEHEKSGTKVAEEHLRAMGWKLRESDDENK
jgi:hypothetical protein